MTSSEDNKIHTYEEFYIPNKPLTRELIRGYCLCRGGFPSLC